MNYEQKDKELLLIDLCVRLPYGVKCQIKGEEDFEPLKLKSFIQGKGFYAFDFYIKENSSLTFKELDEFKPYLFPLSSMTEEQKKEYYSLADDITIKPGQGCYLGIKIHCIKLGISDNPHEEVWDYINLEALDWLNKNHFDYRGLIEKGLAIDCTNLNIY